MCAYFTVGHELHGAGAMYFAIFYHCNDQQIKFIGGLILGCKKATGAMGSYILGGLIFGRSLIFGTLQYHDT